MPCGITDLCQHFTGLVVNCAISNTCWRYHSLSLNQRLAGEMACCPPAPSHYLNHQENFLGCYGSQPTITMSLKITNEKLHPPLPGASELKCHYFKKPKDWSYLALSDVAMVCKCQCCLPGSSMSLIWWTLRNAMSFLLNGDSFHNYCLTGKLSIFYPITRLIPWFIWLEIKFEWGLYIKSVSILDHFKKPCDWSLWDVNNI